MKLILLLIFNIVCFNSISSKNIKPSNIFKGSNFNLGSRTSVTIVKPLPKSSLPKPFRRIVYPKCSDYENGSLFMACCVKGGITPKQFSNACIWAYENKYIKDENHLNMDINDLVKKIAKQFQTSYHSDWKIRGPTIKGHYEVINSKKQIILDSGGLKNHSD